LDQKVKIRKIANYIRKNSFTRAISWLKSTIQVLYYLKTKYSDHELFVSTNPPILVLILSLFKRPFSMIILDLYPDVLVISKFISSSNPIYSIWGRINRKVFARAVSIFTLTNGMAKNLSKYVKSDLIHVIPAWSSGFQLPDYINTPNPFIEKYELHDKFIIMYSGNLGKEHDVEALVFLADELKEIKEVVILIVGAGWKYETIKKEIEERELTNCRLLPKQPVEYFLAALASTDIGVVSLTQSAAHVSIPSKTYNLLAAGKPILCIGGESSDLAELLETTETGAAFSPNKLQEMNDYVLSLKNNEKLYQEYCGNALMAATKFTAMNAHKIVSIHEERVLVRKIKAE